MNFTPTIYVFEVKIPGMSTLRVELQTRNFPQSGTGKGFIPNGLSHEYIEFDYSKVTSDRLIDPGLV